jgi:hypothetical protein
MMTKVIIMMAILCVMGFVGRFDADEAERQASRYCEMVESAQADQRRARLAGVQRRGGVS